MDPENVFRWFAGAEKVGIVTRESQKRGQGGIFDFQPRREVSCSYSVALSVAEMWAKITSKCVTDSENIFKVSAEQKKHTFLFQRLFFDDF